MPSLDEILSKNRKIIYDQKMDEHSEPKEEFKAPAPQQEEIFEPESAAASAYIEPEVSAIHTAPEILSTGISVLDRSMGGGLPQGSVVYITAAIKSMSEVFLYQFTQSRKTYYFCTERRPKYIRNDIQNMNFDVSNVVFVDVYGTYYLTPHGEMIDNVGNEYVDAKVVEFMEYNLKNILSEDSQEDVNIIIDTFSFFLNLNVNQGVIKRLLNIIYETSKEMGGLTYLYSLKDSHQPQVENEIINTCDAIFDVDLEKTGDKIVSKLSIPKIRGMVPTTEMIKFKIGDGIQIDTSKDIA